MKCIYCGEELGDNSVFCSKCGKAVQIVPDYNMYDDDYLKFEDYHEAVEYALSNYDHILICGSLYFISEVRKVFVKQ